MIGVEAARHWRFLVPTNFAQPFTGGSLDTLDAKHSTTTPGREEKTVRKKLA